MNKNLELQKIVINSVNNIVYLKQNNISSFASIPAKTKKNYIKIAGISLNQQTEICKKQTFTIDLYVFTEGQNNRQIMEIMENLYNNLQNEIYNYITINDNTFINLYNVYGGNYTINENLQNKSWEGHFYINIDIF